MKKGLGELSPRHILKSFFFSYAFEWSSILFTVHKLTIRSTLGPNASLGIQDLTSLAYHTISVAIATGRISCHIQLVPVLWRGSLIGCMFQAAVINSWSLIAWNSNQIPYDVEFVSALVATATDWGNIVFLIGAVCLLHVGSNQILVRASRCTTDRNFLTRFLFPVVQPGRIT